MQGLKKKKYYLLFTLIFLISVIFCYQSYIFTGKSFIFEGDGLSQHYKALIYYSNYLREVFSNIFIKHNFVIPQYSFSIGEGAGIIETLHYYVIGDPIAFFSIFVPEDKIYIFYNVTVLLRIYLAGIAFSELCFYKKLINKYAVLSGSLIYMYCFWTIFLSVRHIYFLNPLIYMPLMILGVEKIIDENKPYLFMIMVWVSALSNFYFFYNIVILVIVYVIVRLLVLYKNDFKSILKIALKLLKYSMMGVLLSAVILAPMLYVFLGDKRMGLDVGRHLLYPIDYYKKLPSIYLSTSRLYWLCLGYASPTIIALIYTIKNFKKNKTLSILIIIGFIFILCPIFGQLLNGNSYIANKWSFAFSLIVAYDFVAAWDGLKDELLLLSILYVIVFIVLVVLGAHINTIIPLTLGLLFIIVLWMDKKIKNKEVIQFILTLIVFINVIFTCNWQYSSIGTNSSESATTLEYDSQLLNTGESKLMADYMEDEEFSRFAGNDIENNETLLFDANGIDLYWSVSNSNISEYRSDLGLSEYALYLYKTYDYRPTLYSLANVRYFICSKDNENVPFGYNLTDSIDDYDIYENEYALPFGYTYDSTYSYDEWLSLPAAQKEEVLRKYLVVDGGKTSLTQLSAKNVSYSIKYSDGVEQIDNGFKVNNDNASITLMLSSECSDNLYLSFDGLVYDDGKSWLKGKNTETLISANTNDGYETSFELYTKDDRMYNGREDFTLYFGSNNLNVNNITIIFNKKGNYTFDSLSLYTCDNKSYIEDMIAIQNGDCLDNVAFDTNTVSGSIDCSKDEYLLLSIPYSEGWKAYVDGNEVETLRGNVAYTSIYLAKGYHDIKLVYETPYLKVGAIVSIIGIVIVVSDVVYQRRKKKYAE